MSDKPSVPKWSLSLCKSLETTGCPLNALCGQSLDPWWKITFCTDKPYSRQGKTGFSKSMNPEIALSGEKMEGSLLTSSTLSYPIERLGNVLTKFTDKL